MSRQHFFEFLDKSLANNTLEEKVIFVRDVLPNWISEYHDALISGKKYCSGCKKYIPIEDFSYYEETSTEIDHCHSESVRVKMKAIYSKCTCCGKIVREKVLNTDIIEWI